MKIVYEVTPDDVTQWSTEGPTLQYSTLREGVEHRWLRDVLGQEEAWQIGEVGSLWVVLCHPYYVEVAIPHGRGRTHTTVYHWGSAEPLDEGRSSIQGCHEHGAVLAAGIAVQEWVDSDEEAA